MIGVAISGIAAVFGLFFLLFWFLQREKKFAAQMSGLIALNVGTGIVFSWGLNEAVPMLRGFSESWFWLTCILWFAILLGAIYAPWYFFANKPR